MGPIQLLGFTPDVEITTPGAIMECSNIVPTEKGIRAADSVLATDYAALADAVQGAALLVKLDGSVRFFVGTAAQLMEGSASTWTDRSRGAGYTAGAARWRFAQFGNDSLAANKTCFLQRSTGAAFADLTAPKAALVEVVAGQILLADCDDTGAGLGTSYGDAPNRWWCSGLNDATLWTPSISTQAATGLLVEAPGPIKGWKRLGDNIIAYKERSMFVGRYVGAQQGIWAFSLIPGDIGCASNEAVVNVGTAHYFIGPEDIYAFDGSRPVPIGAPIRKWFFSRLNYSFRGQIAGQWDRVNGLVWWYYPSVNSATGGLDEAIVYDYRSQRWGYVSRSIEFPVEVVADGITYGTLGNLFTTYADMPAIAYGSPFWSSSGPITAVIGTDHKPYTTDGGAGSWSFTTGYYGDDELVTAVTRVNPRFAKKPASATLQTYQAFDEGDPMVTGQSASINALGRFDVTVAATWHQFKISGTGAAEVVVLSLTTQQMGSA